MKNTKEAKKAGKTRKQTKNIKPNSRR